MHLKKTHILFFLLITSVRSFGFNNITHNISALHTNKYFAGRESKDSYQNNSVAYMLRGTVIDSTSQLPLIGASVIINKKITKVTDSYGHFEFWLPDKYKTKNFRIIIASVGFSRKIIKIKNKKRTLTEPLKIYIQKLTPDLNEVIQTCCG